jgi:hypothetical protein
MSIAAYGLSLGPMPSAIYIIISGTALTSAIYRTANKYSNSTTSDATSGMTNHFFIIVVKSQAFKLSLYHLELFQLLSEVLHFGS